MMRIKALGAAVTALLLFVTLGVSPAGALSIDFAIVSGSPTPGDDLVLDLVVDPEGTDLQSWFVQVEHPGQLVTSVSAVDPLIVGGQPFARFSDPVAHSLDGGDASGQWAYALQPPNYLPGGPDGIVFGRIAFTNLGAGIIRLDIAPGGAVGGPGGIDLTGATVFGSLTVGTTSVPEPGTGVLLALGLGGLAAMRRPRRR